MDQDGFSVLVDCDDKDPGVFPGAAERCDGVDNDCDEVVDGSDAVDARVVYVDEDGDGFGALHTRACALTATLAEVGGDCDDAAADVHPGAVEHCDAVDHDCDGDLEANAVEATVWYRDLDGDGHAGERFPVVACAKPDGFMAEATDCDDLDDGSHPGGVEVCDGRDNDCVNGPDDGVAGGRTWYADADGDGFGDLAVTVNSCVQPQRHVLNADDCDDTPVEGAEINPNAEERCDAIDHDCDGHLTAGAVDATVWYFDFDRDGHGAADRVATACAAPTGYVASSDDCDDLDVTSFTGGIERCDGRDNDCNDVADDLAVDAPTWFADTDGDGFGVASTTERHCDARPGWAPVAGDCGATDDTVHPGADETCDATDRNCDGDPVAGAVDASDWYLDYDRDGFGDARMHRRACMADLGWVADASDCDDVNPRRNPGHDELCDGEDNDCDTDVDEDAVDKQRWYADTDLDGFGDPATSQLACAKPGGFVANALDCGPSANDVFPGAEERCDALDRDCDGDPIAGAVDLGTFFLDLDRDGFGTPESSARACTAPSRHVADSTDCDDFAPTVHPGADELCNGVDDDCDTTPDDTPIDRPTWYADTDRDGFGNPASSVLACAAPTDFVANALDCGPGNNTVHPGAPEDCAALDRDCDGDPIAGAIDLGTFFLDLDRDGFGTPESSTRACTVPSRHVADSTDCDDFSPTVHPGADELCNGVDDDCDDTPDDTPIDRPTWYADTDRDGFGNPASSVRACAAPTDFVANALDCGPGDNTVHPGAPERCDALDRNCDGDPIAGAVDLGTFFLDLDRDGFGTPESSTRACTVPSRHVADATDCDDFSPTVHPGADELCNGVDDDCDSTPDDTPIDRPTWYADLDLDGFGDPASSRLACAAPTDFVANADDCGPGDNTVHPGAPERCDALDRNCDGDTIAGAVDGTPWFLDVDADGQGDATTSRLACTAPARHVADSRDCNDYDARVYVGAPERCNGADDDCDTVPDDAAVDRITWYADTDLDGFGDPAVTRLECVVPSGFVANDLDCGPGSNTIHPGAPERCDATDRNCDGDPTLGATDTTVFHRDYDADGQGDPLVTRSLCAAVTGWIVDARDCDDGDAATRVGAPEDCSGADRNCDGDAFAGAVDALAWYRDTDGDGYPGGTPVMSCVQPTLAWRDATDCEEGNATAYPGSHHREVPLDGIDQDCDGRDVCVDLDCDGLDDVALSHAFDGDASILGSDLVSGIGPGLMPTAPRVHDRSVDVVAADLDHDGYIDLIYANYRSLTSNTPDAAIYWGSATGHSASDRTLLPANGGWRVVVADLNGDGWEDVVVGSYRDLSTYNVDSYVYWSQAGVFQAYNRTTLPTHGLLDLVVADFNKDGRPDIMTCNYSDGNYAVPQYIYMASSAGYLLANRVELGITSSCGDAEVADLNRDGWPDLVLALTYDGDYLTSSRVFWGTPTGITAIGSTPFASKGAYDVAIADLDGNGWLDLVFAEQNDDDTYEVQSHAWFGSPAGFVQSWDFETRGARRVLIDDLDDDGDLDVVFASYRQGSVANPSEPSMSQVYWGTGDQSFTQVTELPTIGIQALGVGDFDGDGHKDLFFGGYYSGGGWANQTISSLYYGSAQGFSTDRRQEFAEWGVYNIDVVGRNTKVAR